MNARRQKLQLFIIRMYYTGKTFIWLFFFTFLTLLTFSSFTARQNVEHRIGRLDVAVVPFGDLTTHGLWLRERRRDAQF